MKVLLKKMFVGPVNSAQDLMPRARETRISKQKKDKKNKKKKQNVDAGEEALSKHILSGLALSSLVAFECYKISEIQ